MELEYILVYGNHTKELDEEILGFWESENALNSPDDYLKRLSDVIFIVKIDNNIAAVCSCQLKFVTELKGDFLYYRSFISQNHRNKKIAENLLEKTYNHFNILPNFDEKEVKGIYIIFESEVLNMYVRNYYHPLGGTLVGFEENGNQIRVKYFTDSKF
jgi:hypothetical protein